MFTFIEAIKPFQDCFVAFRDKIKRLRYLNLRYYLKYFFFSFIVHYILQVTIFDIDC